MVLPTVQDGEAKPLKDSLEKTTTSLESPVTFPGEVLTPLNVMVAVPPLVSLNASH
jgi:hypothetical protein